MPRAPEHIDPSDRRRIEEALRERELELRTLADNIPQLAWIADRDGWIYWYNRRWFDYTGTTLADCAGWGWKRVHHPDHVDRVVEGFRDAIQREHEWEDTFPLRAKEGHYRWFLSRAMPVRDEHGRVQRWFGTNTDITEQRFLDIASGVLSLSLDVTETLEQLAKLAVPDIADISIVDVLQDGALKRVAVAHPDPAIAAEIHEWAVRYPPDRRVNDGLSSVLRSGEPVFYPESTDGFLEAVARSADHLRRLRELGISSCIIVPLTARGQIHGAITLIRTGTRTYGRSKLRTALELGRRAGAALDNAQLFRASQEAIRARDDILAIVSHDLRQPLNAIDLAAAMVLAGDLEPKARKRLEMIEKSASRMERLLRDLLDTSSIQTGRFSMVRARIEASAVVNGVTAAHEALAAKHGIRLVRECELDGAMLDGDLERLVQAFGNIVGNAVKFSRPGDVVVFRAVVRAGRVVFSVIDAGPGIPADELPRIFDPYWSAERHAKKGTGLGLYICKSIIEMHGGTISVESTPGVGTTFVVELPVVT